MIDFNVNQYVYVKLTDTGIEELKRQHEEIKSYAPSLGEFKPPIVDDAGRSKFQLWRLMESLGHLCRIGFDAPFDVDIKFEEKAAKKT